MFKKLISAFLVLGTFAVNATVIVDYELDENAGFGWNSNAGAQQIAEAFTVDTATTATDITWWGFFHDDSTIGDFDVLFFSDSSGTPDAVEFSLTSMLGLAGTATGLTNTSGNAIFEFSMSLGSLGLAAGDYWVSIRSSNGSPLFAWSHSSTDGTGNVFARFADDGAWEEFTTGDRDRQAMQLIGVPEPTSLLLIALGFIGLRRLR